MTQSPVGGNIRQDPQLAEFIARISHELKMPLLNIHNIISRHRYLPERFPIDDTLSAIEENVELAVTLGDSLMLLANAGGHDRLTKSYESVNVRELFQRVKMSLRTLSEDFDFNIDNVSLEVSPDAEEVYIQSPLLSAILMNAISNSIKYSDPEISSGWVAVSINTRLFSDLEPKSEMKLPEGGKALIIEVSDNGLGFDIADKDMLFEPMFRANLRVTTGLGLGLAVIKEISQRLRGGVVINSKYDEIENGNVTILRVDLPVDWLLPQ